jgi:hypothetical protein
MAHPLEIALFVVAIVDVGWDGFLLSLKLNDLEIMRKERRNGPMLFMKLDNIRHQVFMLCVSLGMLVMAVIGMADSLPVTAQTKRLLCGLIAGGLIVMVDAYFSYRRRWRMAELIQKYDGIPGGRRDYDPPLPTSME